MQPILKVNLSTNEISSIEIPPDWEEQYLGGASLAARLLYDDLTPDLDPLSPAAPLLFLNGPLSGTAGPATGRFVVCSRSPATGLWGESNCGGFWGVELRKAGIIGLWIHGRAANPVYLCIQDHQVEIRSAGHLWGIDTYETQAILKDENNNRRLRVATIGLAGEKQIPFAGILCDHGRVAGRTGMGAVMGAKNLKAIAVVGNGTIPVFNPAGYNQIRSAANRDMRADALTTVFRELGSAGGAEYFDYLGEMPKRYFQHQHLGETLNISGAHVKDTILAGVSACHACVIACGRVVRLEDGAKRKGPEYETLVGFGPNLGLNDPVLVTRLGELCDRYGLDTISMSNIFGMAYYLYQEGVISQADTGGFSLDWGNPEGLDELINQTANREGFGAYLAEGARALGKRFGHEDQAIQVNGLEVAYHDPRGASGMALVYATSPRGACHNQSDYFFVDIGQIESSLGMQTFGRHDNAQKSANVALHQNWRTIYNALIVCLFANVPPETLLSLVHQACGLDWQIEDLLHAGERAWNLKRAINHRLGLTKGNDTLPKPLLKPFLDSFDGYAPDFQAMLEAYYIARDWDPETGRPSKEKLYHLGLDWVARDLYAS